MHSAYCVCSIEVGMKVVENEWKCSEKENTKKPIDHSNNPASAAER